MMMMMMMMMKKKDYQQPETQLRYILDMPRRFITVNQELLKKQRLYKYLER